MYDLKLHDDNKLIALVDDLKEEIKDIYGIHLKDIILYGSYARGDYDPESDIDIMVLVDLDTEEQRKYWNVLVERVTDLSIKYDIVISVLDNNYEDFNIRASYVPFYKNVMREGIRVAI